MLASAFFFALFTAAFAGPVAVPHEQISQPPPGFVRTSLAPASENLTLRFQLKQNNVDGLTQALMDASTPGSGKYTQWLSQEEVQSFIAPSADTTAAVNKWLAANNIQAQTISPAGDWIQFTIPVSEANTLFHADFSVFTHQASGQSKIRTLAYSLPSDIADAVDLVHPTVSFWNPNGLQPKFTAVQPKKRASVPSSCSSTVTLTCLQDIYNIPTTPATQSSNVLAVSGFIEQYANQADLTTFLKAERPSIANATFSTKLIDGGSNPQDGADAGVEANLDIQMTVGLATNVPVQFVSVGESFNDGDLEGFLDIINFLSGESTVPNVLTTSYGQNENTMSSALAKSLCTAYQTIGARGTSILFASGDGGVAGSQSSSCSKFVPTFPSGCPFMTSVGATSGYPETSASFSSGGFSNYFAQPSYQSSAVSAYLQTLGHTNSGKFNTSGRAFPDVSAQGDNVEIVVDGETGTVGGTSCSSPIFASVVALINDQLISAGGKPLGFLNPFLYGAAATAGAFNDITSGNNPGCNTNGFPATSGWDPVTGLGTPKYATLLSAALAAQGLTASQ